METLAGIFVMLITAVNSLAPQSNLPQVLGVQIASSERSGSSTSNLALEDDDSEESTSSARGRDKAKEALAKIRERQKKVLEAASESAKERREEFQEKLQEIRDERKKKAIENIDEMLTERNSRWVNHWNNVLDRLTEIVAKFRTRADKTEERGRDITEVNAAIAEAETAIADAQSAVTAQSGKVYVITLTSEGKIGIDVKNTLEQFKADVRTVYSSVKKAREAVHDAFKVLASVQPDRDEVEPSASPEATP